jgi:hypothetical protein
MRSHEPAVRKPGHRRKRGRGDDRQSRRDAYAKPIGVAHVAVSRTRERAIPSCGKPLVRVQGWGRALRRDPLVGASGLVGGSTRRESPRVNRARRRARRQPPSVDRLHYHPAVLGQPSVVDRRRERATSANVEPSESMRLGIRRRDEPLKHPRLVGRAARRSQVQAHRPPMRQDLAKAVLDPRLRGRLMRLSAGSA